MSLLADIKNLLRIKNNAFDGEVSDLIDAAQSDLMLSGVSGDRALDPRDPLVKRAISIYVKAHFGWDNPDAERLMQSYEMLKAHLTLSEEYTREA